MLLLGLMSSGGAGLSAARGARKLLTWCTSQVDSWGRGSRRSHCLRTGTWAGLCVGLSRRPCALAGGPQVRYWPVSQILSAGIQCGDADGLSGP